MASTDVAVTTNGLMKGVTMDVTIRTSASTRACRWLAIRSIVFAAWLLGCRIVVNVEPSDV